MTLISPRDTNLLSVNDAVSKVLPHREEWQQLPATEKSKLLAELITNLYRFQSNFVDVGLSRRGYYLDEADKNNKDKITSIETEKTLMILMTSTHLASWLTSIKYSFDQIGKTGKFPKPSSIVRNTDGTFRLNVSPPDYLSWVVSGFSTLELHVENPHIPDVYKTCSSSTQKSSVMEAISGIPLEPQKNQADVVGSEKSETQYNESSLSEIPPLEDLQFDANELMSIRGGKITAVLGCGNFDCPVDLLTALFIENNVVVYKMSPLAEQCLGPFTEIFNPLISRGFLAFTSGGPKEGAELLHHPEVAKWFMTGDVKTANRILFDMTESPFKDREPGTVSFEEMEAKLILKKPFTIELGNCSPFIIAPGEWTDRELYRHARHLSMGLLMNGGHFCAHPQVIVTCKNWPQREQFLQYLRQTTNEARTGGMFYPNGPSNLDRFKKKLAEEDCDMNKSIWNDGNVVFAEDLKLTSIILIEETFCPVAGEFPLDTPPTIVDFLPQAVDFVNSKAHGSLCATIIAKATTPADNEVVEDSILKLNYGSVGLNVNGIAAIFFPQLVWGAYPRHSDAAHLQSGIGFFGNIYGFRRPIKSVFRSSFLGPSHYLQVIPKGGEISWFQKLLCRLTSGICNRSLSSYSIGFIDWIRIGSAALLNL